MSSTEEAELGEILINYKEVIPELQALEEMGHKQQPIPMQTDNTTAHGVFTNNISSKNLNSMDMHFHWIRCRATQGQFQHYWREGATNLRYYVTKHHVEIHHQTVRPIYLTPKIQSDLLRGGLCLY